MQLTDAQAEQFRILYQKHCGRVLTLNEAREQGLRLVRLVQLVYRPIKQNDNVNGHSQVEIIYH